MKPSKHENVRLKGAPGAIALLRVTLGARQGGDGPRRSFLTAGPLRMRCAIGRSGLTRAKREGDGATPVGAFAISNWWMQPVRPDLPRGALVTRTIRRDDGWCDDVRSGAYNRPVRRPFGASCEEMWREDGKYAAVGVLDYNISRRRRGAGSAIFFHLADETYGGTAGCVAISRADMRKLLPRLSRHVTIVIG